MSLDDTPQISRTIGDARKRLEELTPQLNPEMYARFTAEVAQAERDTCKHAADYVRQWCEDVTPAGKSALEDVCGIRDEAQALVASIQAGELTAREGADRLNELRNRHRSVASVHQRLSQTAESIERVNEDPVGWSDSLLARMPSLPRPKFSF